MLKSGGDGDVDSTERFKLFGTNHLDGDITYYHGLPCTEVVGRKLAFSKHHSDILFFPRLSYFSSTLRLSPSHRLLGLTYSYFHLDNQSRSQVEENQ
jgi:hypothetical protein